MLFCLVEREGGRETGRGRGWGGGGGFNLHDVQLNCNISRSEGLVGNFC